MTSTPSACRRCNPASLSLLLVRPSLVSNDPALGVPGAAQVRCEAGLLDGRVPARPAARSRHVLRLLRSGYVHVYLPRPPQGMAPWLVYRITEEADVHPDTDPVFAQHPAPARCSRNGHNTAGMKLLQIPRAGEIDSLWIAYSAAPWSKALRERNAADPRVMQEVRLAGGSANTFAPTVEQLRARVLECAVAMTPECAAQLAFAFNTLVRETQDLVDALQRAAAADPRTRGHEQVVVLRDFAGLAADANALRLRRHALAARELDKPENKHPLRSSELLDTLRQTVVDGEVGRVHERLEHHLHNNVMSRGQFEAYEGMINPIVYHHGPPYWVPLPPTRENIARYGAGKGVRIVPGQREEQIAYARRSAERTWARFEDKYYSEPARRQWHAGFERRMHELHGRHVEQYEADWWAVREAPGFGDYFERHFDEHEPNMPHALHCPGAAYTAEVERALTPAPHSHGAVLDAYLSEIERAPTDAAAVLWRAVVCNQGALLPALDNVARARDDAPVSFFGARQISAEQMARADQPEPNPLAHLRSERPDKIFDLVKGALDLSHNATHPNAAQRAMARYGWLSAALGDAALAGAFAVSTSFSQAAAAAAMVRGATWGLDRAAGRALSARVLNAALAQRALDFALRSVTQGIALDTPLLISVTYPINEARLRLWRERGAAASLRHLERMTHERLVTVHLLTSASELAQFGGDIDRAMSEGGGKVSLGDAGAARLLRAVPLPRTITREALETLWHRRETLRAGAATLGRLAASGAGHSITLVKTLEGRLAVGAVMVNLYGLNRSLAELTRDAGPGQGKDVPGAVLGVMDAAAGTLAGAAEVMVVIQTSRLAAAGGQVAVDASPSLPWIRFAGSVLGAVGGVICGISNFRKAANSSQANVEALYWLSGVSFLGTATASGVGAVGALADALLKAQARNVAARSAVQLVGEATLRRTAGRFAVGGTAAILGLSIPGLGWILLGTAIGFEIWAVMNTATPLQVWVARSHFGTGLGLDADHPKFRLGDWEQEEVALIKLFTAVEDKQ